MLTSICGINWGDEGKGRMVDLLSEDYNIVCRYQGGNNAGHTVVNDLGKFALNLLPSGILRKKVVNVLGNGMVIDLKHLCGEMDKLRSAGVEITPENLKISGLENDEETLFVRANAKAVKSVLDFYKDDIIGAIGDSAGGSGGSGSGSTGGMGGMDVKTLSEILGHNDATITLNRYAHSLLKHKREMMDKLGKRLQ